MIHLRNVTVRIGGRTLLDRVDLDCAAGTLTALVGPNGAGKSTLLSVVAGDLDADAGVVDLGGRPVARHSVADLAQVRSVFPQSSMVRFGYSVGEVVAMGRAMRDVSPDEDADAIEVGMRDAEIDHMADRDAQTLSGGEQARTTFARVLVQDTPIMLLDEPTAALDLRHQERVLGLAAREARKGACVVAVLHDLNLACAYADQIVLLSEGRVVAVGDPWSVMEEERIGAVYRQAVCILSHPERACPVVLTR
ncbi:heme ABC transporter ATP-binding protein [Fulvimarina endophytica]|uniref:Heme ABC transporter ATP-binding protein n=1 Tax=Fulvimarina endophytica TaxID=2293836 RepID=A0A371WXQ4_9HYPH|nr:heme ABC transporter ATP-binding protein [Fulvimarina endophytica]RFC61767.1 heme ABC transporter ATP-binding protein [Fulvimarina endophytica]